MQGTKDSFYIALRDRLVQRDPKRTITIDGATRPAIVVAEDEPPYAIPNQNDAFYLEWGGIRAVHPSNSTLCAIDCAISYSSAGSEDSSGVDRGSDLGSLDADLLAICWPPRTHKYDYRSGDQPEDQGSSIFWSHPELKPLKSATTQVGHQALITIFFYPEVNQA